MAGVYVSVFDNAVNVAVTGASENGVFKWTEMEETTNKYQKTPKIIILVLTV